MTLEIANIKDANLKRAAEIADSSDNTANQGKLDQKELSVFIREAVNSGCDKNAIAELCNQVGVEQATDGVKNSMEKLNQLQKLEEELKIQSGIIKKRNDEIKKLEKEDSSRVYSDIKKELGFGFAGAAVGGVTGALISSTLLLVGSFPGAFIGGLLGVMGGFMTSRGLVDKKSNSAAIEGFENQVNLAELKVGELKAKMQEIQKSL